MRMGLSGVRRPTETAGSTARASRLSRKTFKTLGTLALVATTTACSQSIAGIEMSVAKASTSPAGILASQVAPPASVNMSLVLAGTESKGLQKAAPVQLPVSSVQAAPDEVVVQFKDGQVHSIPGATLVRTMSLPGTAVFKTASGGFSVQDVDSWMQDPDIAYAEPDYRFKALGDPAGPTDPLMKQEWGYYKIHADQTWSAGYRATSSVLVAVVDTGVDYTHPDLSGVVVKGPNLVAGNSDPMDDNDHGTHVSGIIGAVADNGQGIAGVAAGVKIYAIKVLDSTGSGDEDVVAQGILDAVKAGARVINLSLGGPDDVLALHQALQYAQQHGALCVVAAGNDGSDGASYPASYPEALAVGATTPDDSRADFSNYGPDVAIAAPGSQILSTVPGDDYQSMDGTSMATPYVSAAAAVIWSLHPELTAQQVRTLLVETADPTTGFSEGKVGRLDLLTAVEKLENVDLGSPGSSSPGIEPTPSNPGLDPTPTFEIPAPTVAPTPATNPSSGGFLGAPDPVPTFGSGTSVPTFGSPTAGGGLGSEDPVPTLGGSDCTPTFGSPTAGGGLGGEDPVPTLGGSDSIPTYGSPTVGGGLGSEDAMPTFGAPVSVSQPADPLDPWLESVATAFGLAAQASNVKSFLAESKTYQTDGTLGPGTTQTAAVSDLQRALSKLGYAASVTGAFDASTRQAVIAYKQANHIHQSYRNADGTWAVNAYVPPGMFDLVVAQAAGAVR